MNGIMNMDKYLIGNFQVVPMKILEEGLATELLITVSDELDKSHRFEKCQGFLDVESQLTRVGEKLDSLKTSVEYIQDLVNIYGLKIWYDEYNKLISTYIDFEWDYIRRKELPDEALKWASSQNSDDGVITSKIKTNNLKASEGGITFLGRVINVLMTYSDPRRYSYIPNTLSFMTEDCKGFSVTMNTFSLVKKCIGVNGLYGMDKLLSFMIVSEMYTIQNSIQKIIQPDKQYLSKEAAALGSLNKSVKNIDAIYKGAKKRLKTILENLITSLERIGHLVVLRSLSLNELNLASRKDSHKLYLLLEATNQSLINELNSFDNTNLRKEEIDAQSAFLKQLSSLSIRLGFADPIEKVYFKPKPLEFIPLLVMYCFYYLVSVSERRSARSNGTRTSRRSSATGRRAADGTPSGSSSELRCSSTSTPKTPALSYSTTLLST